MEKFVVVHTDRMCFRLKINKNDNIHKSEAIKTDKNNRVPLILQNIISCKNVKNPLY